MILAPRLGASGSTRPGYKAASLSNLGILNPATRLRITHLRSTVDATVQAGMALFAQTKGGTVSETVNAQPCLRPCVPPLDAVFGGKVHKVQKVPT